MRKVFTTAMLFATAVSMPLVMLAGPASASPELAYEVDNGAAWTLTGGPSAVSEPLADGAGYGDAGVVFDIGSADDFSGITFTGSDNLADNIWIGDGSEASVPGTHPFGSDPVNFSYGFDNGDGTFWMTSGPYAGQSLSAAQISDYFSGDEVYAWVGVVYAGADVEGVVTSINGQHIGHRSVSVAAQAGVLAASVN